MESFALFEKKYKSQMSKKDKYKVSRDYLMLKTQQSKLGKIPDKYKERRGLEGPFMTKSGQVVYYDKKFGQYYNSDTDMYIDYDDWKKMSEDAEDYLKSLGNIRVGKYDKQGNWHSVSTSDKKEIEKLKRQGYKVVDEEAPANATGTAVAGTGDDSSTVVVKKKKKPLQDKLMRRLKINEAIDRAVPDLVYPKDKITERKQQLIDMARNYGKNI